MELSEDGVDLGELIPDDFGNKDIHHNHCALIVHPPHPDLVHGSDRFVLGDSKLAVFGNPEGTASLKRG